MTRGHGWSLTFTMWGTFTPYFMPAFTGAFYGFIIGSGNQKGGNWKSE